MIRSRGCRTNPQGEDGATTVMVALLALVLFGAGALAVDVGQVMAKRSALQSNVDHAVMAAAAELDNAGGCNPEVIATATAYLLKAANEVPDQATVDLTGSPDDGDGYITCNDWRVDLWAPASHVSYGLAQAVTDTEGVDVPAHAAAQIKSPSSSKALPMYAVSGCDYGPQQLTDPPPGSSSPGNSPPSLSPGSTPGSTVEFTIDPDHYDPTVDSPPVQMTLELVDGTGTLDDVVLIGFTKSTGEHFEVPPSNVTANEVTVTVPEGSAATPEPEGVLDDDGIWWVRVWNGSRWTKRQLAQSFLVGDLLFCDGSVSGNFGTIRLARTDTNSQLLEWNIMKGPEPSLVAWPTGPTPCEGTAGAVMSPPPSTVNDGTNCLGSDPGFPGEAATQGFIDGVGSEPGRLAAPTTPGCSRNDSDSQTVQWNGSGPRLNDDQLGCFVIDGGLSAVTSDTTCSSVGNVLSSDILNSPRFFYVPVIPVEAANGASGSYPILEFRPGFITSEGTSGSLGDYNGLIPTNSGTKIQQLNVLFFNECKLPETAPAVGGEIDYTGSGIKVLVLVE